MALPEKVRFHYDDTPTQADRVALDKDHCQEPDDLVLSLEDIVINGIAELDGTPLTTAAAPALGSYIYAVRDGQIKIAPDGQRGTHGTAKHETLFHNLPVDIAGEIRFVDGIVVEVNDHSGSYRCWTWLIHDEVRAALRGALKRAGVSVAPEVYQALA